MLLAHVASGMQQALARRNAARAPVDRVLFTVLSCRPVRAPVVHGINLTPKHKQQHTNYVMGKSKAPFIKHSWVAQTWL